MKIVEPDPAFPESRQTSLEILTRCLRTLKSIFEERGRNTTELVKCISFFEKKESVQEEYDSSSWMNTFEDWMFSRVNGIYDGIYVNFDTEKGKARISNLHLFFEREKDVREAILVTFFRNPLEAKQAKLTSQANGLLINFEKLGQKVNVFSSIELSGNILDWNLQPKIRVLPEQEAEEVFALYGKKFPMTLSNDPIAIFLGASPGQLLEILKPSISFGDEMTCSYSIVI